MNKNIYNKGFTLIELLVVIAIIGILSTIVLTSLSSSREQAEDASIKSTLNNMRSQAEIYYLANNNFGATNTTLNCTDVGTISNDSTSGTSVLVTDLKTKSSAVVCNSNSSSWAVSAQLVSDATKYACVDSTGIAKTNTAQLTLNDTTCN